MNNGEVGGSRGRGCSWKNPESNQPRELRRPKQVLEEPKGEIKSNLSAEAKEWYPPNYVPTQAATYAAEPTTFRPPRFSAQNRLRQQQDQDIYNFENMSYSIEETINPYLREKIGSLINVMCEITLDPGRFDSLCGHIVDSFAQTIADVNYTNPLVEAIVNQSIAESNFRYNGARLCSMYDSLDTPGNVFRNCLLERCKVEENKIVASVETSEENIRGFAMFLAEIYTQLEDSQGGRIKSLGESLCKVLTHLLDTDKEVNIKAVCQLLKLSGLALDADCPGSVHAAFERLKGRSQMAAVSAVMALRNARWGLAEESHAHAETAHRPLVTYGMNTTIAAPPNGEPEGGYLADGQTLTDEEAAFLQTHLRDKYYKEDIPDDEDNVLIDDSEMDEEMQEGFLEFLLMSNQIRR